MADHQYPTSGLLDTLPPLRPVEHLVAQPGAKRSRRRVWVWVWSAVALILVAAAAVIGTMWFLDHQQQVRAEQATVDAQAHAQAIDAHAVAFTDHINAVSDVAAYGPRLETTAAKANEHAALFGEPELQRFTAAVAEYLPFAAEVTTDAPESIASAELETAYRASSESYEAASIRVAEATNEVAERAEQIASRTAGIEQVRADVDAAIVALAASAVKQAPSAEQQFPKASDTAKQKVTDTLGAVAQVADGTFAATPKRMPTAALYEYVNAVLAADASHANAVESERLAAEAAEAAEKAEAARLAAEAEAAAAVRSASGSSSGSSGSVASPTYSGGGSKEEWMSAAGISESDWGYVDYIVSKESSWNPNAINSSSGACGLVQIMPLHTAAYETCTDPVANLSWANNYASYRYGGWAGAYEFWINNHWW